MDCLQTERIAVRLNLEVAMLHITQLVCVLFLVSASVFGSTPNFPESLERCAAGDTKCLAQLITKLMAGSRNGIPELGLESLDPLFFGNSSVSQQNAGPVSMNLTVSGGSILGWSKMKVKKVIGFGKDPRTSEFELFCFVPVDTILGQYDLNGRALLIPVAAKGAVNLTFEHLDMKVKFLPTVVTRAGEDYLELQSIDVKIKTKKMYTHFDHLFQDDAISDNANSLMNQYHEALFGEIRHSFGQARSAILMKILKPLFSKYPYRMWFKDL